MPATIQTIHKPTRARGLDTSGNKNHAQIYSGRGLEFDGVGDYLTIDNASSNYLFVNKTYTVSCWLKINTLADSIIWMRHDNSTPDSRVGLILNSSGFISHSVWNGTAYVSVKSETALNTNTWYRVICTNSGLLMKDGGTAGALNNDDESLKLYVNAYKMPENDSEAFSSTFSSTNSGTQIGARSAATKTQFLNGCLSDFQVWDKVWTQDEVTYDYLNPEQLVLNRGGSSLTNSNLKLWYPMNEGHRGNQSYVLDASNTGIGDDILNWSSTFNASGTSTDDFGDWTTNANDSTTFCTFDHDNKTVRLRTTDSTHVQAFYVPEILKYGTTYKFEFTVSEITSGSVRIRPQNTTEYLTVSETGTYSYIVSPENSTTDLDFRIERHSSEATDVTISDLKIFPINDKHNATTVFYGDELVTNGTMEADSNWNNQSSPTTNERSSTQANNGTYSRKAVGDSAGDGLKSDTFSLVAGRTYQVEFYYYLETGSNNLLARLQDGDGSDLGDSQAFGTKDAWTKITFSRVAETTGSSSYFKIYQNGAGSSTFYIDDVSVKEVGTATGWTDADQQLDIPQTALQSYNQLGFSYGAGDTAGGAISCGAITSGSWTTLDIWFFPQESGYNQGLLDQIAWNGDDGDSSTGGYGFRVTISSTDKITLTRRVSGTNTSNTMTSTNKINIGEWNHVAVVIPKNTGTSMRMMVNGHYEQTNTSGDHGNTSKDFRLGYGGGINYDSMPGCIAQASYFKEHMSETQMLELYNEGTPIDSRNHSVGTDNLAGYWRNNGIYGNTWTNLANPGTNDGTPQSLITETMLITAGVDSSRDSQGFFMNRKRTTNTLNLPLINIAGNTYTIGSSEIEIPNPSLTYSDTGFSVECWFKAAILGEPMFFICHQEGGNSAEGFHLRWAGGNVVYAVISDGTNEANAQVNGALNADQWYHIVASWDHSNKKKYVYIDGILRQVETESSMGTIAPDADIHIGTRRGEADQDFIGQIDDVKLYNRILTDGGVTTGQSDSNGLSIAAKGEVLRNYNAGKRSHK